MRIKLRAGRNNTKTNQVQTRNLAEGALERAKEIQANLGIEFPTFLKSLTWSNFSYGKRFYIPISFSRLHLLGDDKTVTLMTKSECESEYKVTYLQRTSELSVGWKRFFTENDLGVGHVLVFQLIGHFKFKVYIVRTGEDKRSGHEKKSGSAKRPCKDFDMFTEEGVSSPRSPPKDFVMFTKEGSDKRSAPSQETPSAKRPCKSLPQRISGENIKQKSEHSCEDFYTIAKDFVMFTKERPDKRIAPSQNTGSAKRPCKSPPQHIPKENIKQKSVHSSVSKDSDIFTKKVFSSPRSPPEDLVMFSKEGADKRNAPSLNTGIAKGPSKSLPPGIPGENIKEKSVHSRVSKDFDMFTKEGDLSPRSPPKDFVMLTKEGADKKNAPSQNTGSAKGCCKPLPQHVPGENIKQNLVHSYVSKDFDMFTKEGADKRNAPSYNTAKRPRESLPQHTPGEIIKQKSVHSCVSKDFIMLTNKGIFSSRRISTWDFLVFTKEEAHRRSASWPSQNTDTEKGPCESLPQNVPGENIKQKSVHSCVSKDLVMLTKEGVSTSRSSPKDFVMLTKEGADKRNAPSQNMEKGPCESLPWNVSGENIKQKSVYSCVSKDIVIFTKEEADKRNSPSQNTGSEKGSCESLPQHIPVENTKEKSVHSCVSKDFIMVTKKGVFTSRSPPKFEKVHSIADFQVVVNGLHIDDILHVRTKYYKLCCSQKSYLHENILECVNNSNWAASIISQIVNTADAMRSCTYYTPVTKYTSWSRFLCSFEELGMNVGFIRARLNRLERLSGDNAREDNILRTARVAKAGQELLNTEEKIAALEIELSKLKREKEVLAAEIEGEKKTLNEREQLFEEEVDAPW